MTLNNEDYEKLKKIILDLRKDFKDLKKIIHEEILNLEENPKEFKNFPWTELKELEDE